MANTNTNTYEEARLKRLEDNKKRFEDLGILKISKNLSDLTNSEKSQQRLARPKSKSNYVVEPRRSSRARNPVTSYFDEVDIGVQTIRKRSKINSSWTSYLARPLNETKFATYGERVHALNEAEDLQKNLQSGNPSFVKSMVRSHVYSCFWLGLPSKFCEEHLPKTLLDMVLEDENGAEYEAVYIGNRAGLSGGWRAFALEHKLDDGDALVFDLIEPTRFKIYIVKASQPLDRGDDDENEVQDGANKISKGGKKLGQNNVIKPKGRKKLEKAPQKSPLECEADGSSASDSNEGGFSPKKRQKRGNSTCSSKSENIELAGDEKECALNSTKRAHPTMQLRKRVQLRKRKTSFHVLFW